jgi:uncharacterized protein
MNIKIEYDKGKSDANMRERGIPFTSAIDFDYDTAVFRVDSRRDYGETRINAIGYIGQRLHVLCFKPIAPRHIRVISLRKANLRERTRYEKEIKGQNENDAL